MDGHTESVNTDNRGSTEKPRNHRATVDEARLLPMLAGEFRVVRLDFIRRGRAPARLTFEHAGQMWTVDIESSALLSFAAFREKSVELLGILPRSEEFERDATGAAWLDALSSAANRNDTDVDMLAGLDTADAEQGAAR